MRVLFVTRKFPPSVGGMETWSKELYDAFRALGADVDLHKPATDHIGLPSLWQMATFFFATAWTLLRHGRRYDAVLVGDFALATVAIVAKLATFGRVRTVVQLHGHDVYFLRTPGLVPGIYRALCRLVVGTRAVDAAIANSQSLRDEAVRHGLPRPAVIPLATVAPPVEVMATARRGKQLLFAGRLLKLKGLAWFVREVWPHVDPSLELLVAGPVWDAGERDALEGQPRVRYLGTLPYAELPALRASVLACVMPNLPPGTSTDREEGFGLAALEGPAVGTPTLASRSGGLPDAVADGITGFLLPPLDARAWVECIDRIAAWSDETRATFAERARDHVLAHYRWDRVARQTLDVLADRPLPGTAAGPAA